MKPFTGRFLRRLCCHPPDVAPTTFYQFIPISDIFFLPLIICLFIFTQNMALTGLSRCCYFTDNLQRLLNDKFHQAIFIVNHAINKFCMIYLLKRSGTV